MDFSQNNTSGEIPNFLESFSTLQYFNLSFNILHRELSLQAVHLAIPVRYFYKETECYVQIIQC
jgi:hypothetical protein